MDEIDRKVDLLIRIDVKCVTFPRSSTRVPPG
jgi:hypothetical protein